MTTNIVCDSCKSNLSNIDTICPYCRMETNCEARCLTCGNLIGQIEFWSNHNRCPKCTGNDYKSIINNRKENLLFKYSYLSLIKPLHNYVLKKIEEPEANPFTDWKIGLLIILLLLVLTIPLLLLAKLVAYISFYNIIAFGIIYFILIKWIWSKFPTYFEFFKFKEIAFALLSATQHHSSISKESGLILRGFNFDREKKSDYWINYLTNFMLEFGKVFTIGKPGDIFQNTKAQKIYLNPHENWYEILKNSINKVKLILIIHDGSQGLIWEIKQCLQSKTPEQVYIFIPPPGDHDLYLQMNEILNKEIEHLIVGNIPMLDSSINKFSFIGFSDNWQPYIIKPSLKFKILYYLGKFTKTETSRILFTSYFLTIAERLNTNLSKTLLINFSINSIYLIVKALLVLFLISWILLQFII